MTLLLPGCYSVGARFRHSRKSYSEERESKMNTSRKTAIIVGALFLTAMVTSILGGTLIEPVLSVPDDLINLSSNQTQLVSGVLLELVNAIAVVGIAVLMFPILKKHAEALALGYVGIRIIEAVMQIVSDVIPLSLLTVSQENI
jgi:mannose/fructose/N-acetylgalactosamine-specific phosphotransferase system component IID